MKHFFIFFILLISNVGFSQNEANIWYFGQNSGLDFNSGSPVALTDGQMITQEGCASIANTNGILQFYTDGSTIWNRSHSVMINGSDLNGNFSSTQSAIIVPKPGSNTIYYVFTVDFQGAPNGLQYSEVDMSLDGSLGGVTSNKNILLLTPVLEKLTAVKHANGTDIWVISHKNGSSEFYSYLVTNGGVQNTPTISNIGPSLSGSSFEANAGYMKVSPDGTKLAFVRPVFSNGLQLYDFDNATGSITNLRNFIEVPGAVQPYGVEFSPDGNLLYISGSGGISQFDLSLSTPFEIGLNFTLLSNEIPNNAWRAMQLAVDGKIYITRQDTSGSSEIQALSVINNPNELGISCDFQIDTISLGTGIAQSGLPQFIQSFFLVGFQSENYCLGEATIFTSNISQSYDTLIWDFGDGNTSTDENPTYTFNSPGNFDVTLTVTSDGQTTSDTKTITIYEQPIANPIPDQIACDEDGDGFYFYDLTIHASDILNGQDPNTFILTYYDGIVNYNNNSPIVDETLFENLTLSSADPVVSVSNINNPECEAIVTIHIDFLEGANPSQNVIGISECDNTSVGSDTDGIIEFDLTQNETTILNGQSATNFTVNYYTDSGLTNLITNPTTYQNTNVSESIYVEMVNNTSDLCSGTTSFNIEVLELPTITPIVTIRQCDDDLDGFSTFNLTEVNAELSTNFQNEIITFYESLTDAENGNNLITNVIAYMNQNVSNDTVWARIENTNGCHRTAQVNLIVSTTQIPNTYTRNFYQCDDGTDTTDGIATFNLSSIDSEIQALFPVGQQLIIKYYRNQADALSEVNPITDITSYQNIGYPNQQDVFIRIDSALDNDCLGLGHHITLYVDVVPTAHSVIIEEQCDADADGLFEFDTSTIETTLLNGQTGMDISYKDELGNPLPNPLPNPFNTATQTITARVTNASSQDPNGACFDETQITFTVEAAAIANPIVDFIACDDDNDGLFAFDTSSIETDVLNGQIGMNVSYFDANGNILQSPLSNPFTTSTQTITVRVENQLNAVCFDETTINFIVSEQPIANPITNDFVCDDLTNDGEHVFTLTDYTDQILNGQSSNMFEVLYFEDISEAQNNIDSLPSLYTVNSTSQILYARIQNVNNPNCFDITPFELGVHYIPIANQPDDISVCDDETNDGMELFDLSSQNSIILNGLSSADYKLSYHLSLNDADLGENDIDTDFTNTEIQQIIYARLENNISPSCYTTTSFNINVNEQPILLMNDIWSICEGSTVDIIADSGYDEYLWSTGETTRIITVDDPGTYSVTATNIFGTLRCETSKTITVNASNIATIIDIETIDWTLANNSITVNITGNGDYEYSLDGFTFQESNQFNNLTVEEYTVYVKDKLGCGTVSQTVYLLGAPRFFTPNGDGNNDHWQIINGFIEPTNIIRIYDRYGKLLKQLSPISSGWDGTHNGNLMPTNDYWFVVEREDGRAYTGHFTLKR